MIKARGIKDGKKVEVIYNNKRFTFNGKESDEYESLIGMELRMFHPIGGTYFAEDEYEPLNIAEVLRCYFFDKPTLDIESDEEQMLEAEEGVVY